MKKCFIFGALDIDAENLNFNKNDGDIIIAADNGLKTLKALNIQPDIIIGDFDSLGYVPKGDNVIKHPIIKDDTDTLLCIKKAFELGFRYFEIFGCLGGRLDHTFANIQTASYVAENNGIAVFYDSNFKTSLTVIKNNCISFSSECKGNISVFSVSDKSYGVTEKGLLYEVIDCELSSDFPLGVSNEFKGIKSFISVTQGKLCIIWDNISGNFFIGGNYDK